MADARAGVDIVVAEARAHQLLNEEHFLVGAARGGDRADGIAPVHGLDAFAFVGGMLNRLVPRDLPPRILDAFADHWLCYAVPVGSVTISEPALDARMPLVGLAGLVRNQAKHFVALQLRLERAADAAI